MSLRTFLLIFALILSFPALAQDIIYKKDGTTIKASISSVNNNTIVYKRSDNVSGPDYTILKKEVTRIVYQNGTSDIFDKRFHRDRDPLDHRGRGSKDEDRDPKKYGSNILSILPGVFTADVDGTLADPGIGIAYERLLDDYGHIGFSLPVILNFTSNQDFTNNRYSSNPPPNASAAGYNSVMLTPGIKFYPAASYKPFRYAIGASFFMMFGKQPWYVYDYTSSSLADRSYAVYGPMITNSFNMTAAKHFYIGIDLNTAMPISDNRYRHADDFDIIAPWMQFAVRVGYRF